MQFSSKFSLGFLKIFNGNLAPGIFSQSISNQWLEGNTSPKCVRPDTWQLITHLVFPQYLGLNTSQRINCDVPLTFSFELLANYIFYFFFFCKCNGHKI